MMDLSDTGSGSQDTKKSCVDCKTTKTPLWRGGPAGPKSLCNACGIKHRKKRRAMMAMSKADRSAQSKEKKTTPTTTSTAAASLAMTSPIIKKGMRSSKDNIRSREDNKMDASLKLRLLTLGRQVLLRRSGKQRKLCEEEEAAVLLMALSCGSCYA